MKHILALGLVAFMFVATACGDKESGASNPDCTATGVAAVNMDGTDCCSNHRDEISGLCSRVPGTCVTANDDCSIGPDCCSFSCIDFKCSGDQCTSDTLACDQDGECCSGICSGGSCAPLSAECRTSGNTCATNGECCSGFCKDNGSGVTVCNNAPSFCSQAGDACVTDTECCGGFCTKAQGASLGLCALVPSSGAGNCASAGEVCAEGADFNGDISTLPTCGGECCSKACFPYGPTGVLVCQPPSGCKPTGELCYEHSDCCGGEGNPDADRANVMCRKEAGFNVGRCDNGNACAPAGDICRLATTSCNDTDRCCAGTVQTFPEVCRQDNLGIPRCGIGTDIDCNEDKTGMACATSADCCGKPCVYVPGSELGYVCGASCVAQGGACTTTADCCSGLPCNITPGSSEGVCGTNQGCADYGQMCDVNNNTCCNGVPCSTEGFCGGGIIL